MGRITRRDLLGFRKYVWIDRGSNDGLKPGQPTVAKGSLFGVIDEVYKSSSRVQTILDPEFRATAEVKGSHGIVKNKWGSLVFDLVPSKNAAHQVISTDGLDDMFRKGILIGKTASLNSSDSDVFGVYSVELPIGVYDIDIVEVLGGL